jgi:hypothetical protein
MPSWMTDEELARHERNAALRYKRGQRIRSWLIRLWITPISDLLYGKVWPLKQPPHDGNGSSP